MTIFKGIFMGLNCTHNAFDGAYSAFNRFRQAVCFIIGGSYPPHYLYQPDGQLTEVDGHIVYQKELDENRFYWGEGRTPKENPGLWEFLTHSDCDGSISPSMCKKVANELEELVPAMRELNWEAHGHLERNGGYAATLEQFIAGCRAAHKARQSLKFR